MSETQTQMHQEDLDFFKELSKPFGPDEIKKHPVRGLEYITARTIQLRLDKVCGPMRWTMAYDELRNGGVKCTLSIQTQSGEWYQRDAMAGPTTHMSDPCDALKASCSEAFKVAASNWGIGRELYGDGETYYPGEEEKTKPERPVAPYKPVPARTKPDEKPAAGGPKPEFKKGMPPKAGNPKAPFAWLKILEEMFAEEFIKQLCRQMEDAGRAWDSRNWSDDDIEFARSLLYMQFCHHPAYDGCLDPPAGSTAPATSDVGKEMAQQITNQSAAQKQTPSLTAVERVEIRDHLVGLLTVLIEQAGLTPMEGNYESAAEELLAKYRGVRVRIKDLASEMRIPLLVQATQIAEERLASAEETTFETFTL